MDDLRVNLHAIGFAEAPRDPVHWRTERIGEVTDAIEIEVGDRAGVQPGAAPLARSARPRRAPFALPDYPPRRLSRSSGSSNPRASRLRSTAVKCAAAELSSPSSQF